MRLVVTVRMVHAREQDQREWTGVAMFKMVSALIAAVAIAAALIMVPGVSDTAHAKRVAS